MPKFSVVISVYNKANFIRKTIESVLAQKESDYEIIIVNDASTDKSEQVIQSFLDNRISYNCLKENSGAAAARNKGVELATGQYIAFLDGDDLWDKNYLSTISDLITHFPDHSVFATAVQIQEHDGYRDSKYTFQNPEKKEQLSLNYFESSLKNTILTSSSTVVKKSVFGQTGTYDTRIKSGQDTDLWVRIGLQYRVAFSTKALVTYTFAPESLYQSVKTVTDKPTFVAYEVAEKDNPALKKFLDLNRFSLAIRAKLWKEPQEAQFFIDRIDPENLTPKQRRLLKASPRAIRLLFSLKKGLEKVGLRLSVH